MRSIFYAAALLATPALAQAPVITTVTGKLTDYAPPCATASNGRRQRAGGAAVRRSRIVPPVPA